MKVRSFGLFLFALALPLQGASVTDRLDRLENEVSEIRRLLNQLNHNTRQPREKPRTSGGYTVKSGDSYWSIARRHGISVSALERANPGVNPRRLSIGKNLTIPGSTSRTSNSTPTSRSGTYTVKKGDILGRISEAHGIRLHELMSANPGLDSRRLRIGAVLKIPGQLRAASVPPIKEEPKKQKQEATPRENPYLSSSRPGVRRVEREMPKIAAENSRLVQIARDSRLAEIASHYRTTVAQLNKLNNVKLSPEQMIQTGSQLYVPGR